MTGQGSQEKTDRTQTDVGKDPVSAAGIWVLAALLLAASVTVLYGLAVFLPPAVCSSGTCDASLNVRLFDVPISLSRETALLVIVMLSGALGALLHGLRSLARYVGERYLFRSWLLLYISLPVVGALIATIVYVVVRAGLMAGAGDASNAYGFAAVASLVGLFSAQATEKLKKVFEVLFERPEAAKDPAPSVAAAAEETSASQAGTPPGGQQP